MLGEEGESCTAACSRNPGMTCTSDSLKEFDKTVDSEAKLEAFFKTQGWEGCRSYLDWYSDKPEAPYFYKSRTESARAHSYTLS